MPDDAPNVFNPYPGLRPFRTDEDYLFFGREEQTSELLTLLRKHRLLAVVGTSGSGKSSLVRAGLLPELQGGTMNVAGSEWEIVLLRPGGNPNLNLAQAIADAELYDGDDPETLPRLMATLQHSAMGLVEAYRQSPADHRANLLVVVDQFEEIFRFRQTSPECRDQALAFVNLLLEASRQQELPIYVVITMRSDYLGDCSQFRGLAEAVNRGEYLIPRLNRHQLQAAIEGPAKVGGGEIAYRLVQHLLNDVGDDPDQLPILQHALMRTWAYWLNDQEPDEPVDLRHYEAVGGMSEALARHADEVLEALPNEEHRLVAERVFQALTEKGADNRGIRRANRLSQLAGITGADQSVVATVVDAYRRPGVTFLMPGFPESLNAKTVVDISHESLMRVWYRLRRWVDEEAQSARVYRRLTDTAQLWHDGKAGLYHDPDLQIAQSWREDHYPNEAWAEQYGGAFREAMEFLDKSRTAAEATERAAEETRQRELAQARRLAETKARAARNFKIFAAALAVFGMLALSLSVWAIRMSVVAARNYEDALSSKRAAELASQQAYDEAQAARQSHQRAQSLLAESRHEQGKVSLELARGLLRDDKHHLGAKLLAAQAIGFDGFGRRGKGIEFTDRYPVLLKRNSPEWKEVERFIRFQPEFPTIWRTPSSTLPAALRCVRFSPDGTLLASCGQEPVVRIWDVNTGNQVGALEGSFSDDDMVGLCFSPGGETLAVGSAEVVSLWSVKRLEHLESLTLDSPVRALDYSRDGTMLAAGCASSVIYVWDAATLQERYRFGGDSGAVRCCAFRPDNRQLAVGYFGGVIRVWNLSNGSSNRWRGHEGMVRGLDYSDDGSLLASGGHDRKVCVWNADDRSLVVEFTVADDVRDVDIAPDGNSLAAAAHQVYLFDLAQQQEVARLTGHSEYVRSVQFSPDGRQLVSGGTDNTIRVWNVAERTERRAAGGHYGRVLCVAFSPDGRWIASGSADESVRLWDMRDGSQFKSLPHDADVESVAFAPDGRTLVTVTAGTVRVWNVETGEEVERFAGQGVRQAVLRADGGVLVGACGDAMVRRWNMPGGSTAGDLPRRPVSLRCIDASADGRLLAVGGDDGSVFVWDVTKQQEIRSWKTSGRIDAICLDPDGQYVAAGGVDRVVRVWPIESAEPQWTIDSANRRVLALEFNHDGSWLAAGFAGGEIGLWRADTGRQEATLLGHLGGVHSLAFAPDGRSLASGGEDHSVRLWEVAQPEISTLEMGPSVLSKDGSTLAVGGPENLRLMDAVTKSRLRDMERSGPAFFAFPTFSPDGNYLSAQAISGNDRSLGLWHTETGRRLMAIDDLALGTRTSFTPDGTRWAVPMSGLSILIRDPATGDVLETLTTRFWTTVCCYSEDGTKLAAGGSRGEIAIWDSPGLTLLWEVPGHITGIRVLCFSPDGVLLASGDQAGKVQVWNLASQRPVWDIDGFEQSIQDLAFSPDGKILAICASHRTVTYDLDSREMLTSTEAGDATRLSFGDDGTLVSGGYRRTVEIRPRGADTRGVDYAAYVDRFRFLGREVKVVPELNLYQQQAFSLKPRTSISYFSVLRDEDPVAMRKALFRRFLRANNLSGAIAVMDELGERAAGEERELLARSLATTALRLARRDNLPLAEYWLSHAERVAPTEPILWITRSRILREQERTEEAVAIIDQGIRRSQEAGEDHRPQLLRLARYRLQLNLETQRFEQGREDLAYLFAQPELSDGALRTRLLNEYLEGRTTVGAADADALDLALTVGMLKSILVARRQPDPNLLAVPEIRQVLSALEPERASPILVKADADWKYLDDGSPPDGWTDSDFDDQSWKAGPAPLGFGRGREATTLSDQHSAYFFRHEFQVEESALSDETTMVLDLIRDDGAVIHLNGQELLRDNMPDGDIDSETFAASIVGSEGETRTFTHRLPAQLLRVGRNVLAVQVHQANAGSSDINLQLELRLDRPAISLLAERIESKLDRVTELTREILPEPSGTDMSKQVGFAFAENPAEAELSGFDSEAWVVRARIQSSLRHPSPALSAFCEGLARSLVDGAPPTAASSRAENESELQRYVDQVPGDDVGLKVLAEARDELARVGPAALEFVRRLDLRAFRILVRLENFDAAREALGRLLDPSLSLPVASRAECVREFLDLYVGTAPEDSDQEATRDRLLMLALLKLHEAALETRDIDLDSIPEWAEVMSLGDAGAANRTLIDKDATWRYLDGTAPPNRWRAVALDDATWQSGVGPFGFGDQGRENTSLTRGSLTYYFRAEFEFDSAQVREDTVLVVRMARDDGVVVHLNEKEILRDNMPSETIEHDTPASQTIGGGGETAVHEFTLDVADLLRSGKNVLAVEVHQRGPTSTDLFLDLTLSVERKVSGFITRLRPDSVDRAMELAQAVLPPSRAETWIASVRFCLAETVDPASAPDATAEDWMARGHVRWALEDYEQTMVALNQEAQLRDARDAPGSVARCYEMETEMERALARLNQLSSWNVWWRSRVARRLRSDGAYRINCGGGAYLDQAGAAWGSDRGFQLGGNSTLTGEIAGTDDDLLYQNRRWSSSPNTNQLTPTYSLALPNGKYQVVLHFCDGTGQSVGGRVFDVYLEDRPELTNYDITASVGTMRADVKSLSTTVADGSLDIGFATRGATAMISAIEVKPAENR